MKSGWLVAIALATCAGCAPSSSDSSAASAAPANEPAPAAQPAPTTGDASSAVADAGPAAVDAGFDAATFGARCGAFPPAGDLSKSGPFGSVTSDDGNGCTIVRPTDANLKMGGVQHPVIVWGNGTGAVVSVYQAAFDLWASHGFIVAAANASNGQGAGTPLLDCLDHVLTTYAADVCATSVGASGHSQGGGGAIMAGHDTRITVTAPVEPYIQQGYGGFDQASITAQHGPMLLLSGSADNNAVPAMHQKPVFVTTNVPVFWATLNGGDHYVSALGLSGFREIVLAWFRLQLMGDVDQQAKFYGPSCTYCVSSSWTVARRGL
jgi:hypothetical protein